MKKTFKIYLFFFAILTVGLVALELSKTDVIDWRKNFDPNEKTPFGLFVLNEEIGNMLQKQLTKTNESPYQYYEKRKKNSPHNIIIIAKTIDATSWKKVEKEVEAGAQLFFFSENYYDFPEFIYSKTRASAVYDYNSVTIQLTDKKLATTNLILDQRPHGGYFSRVDKGIEVLGNLVVQKDRDIKRVNFIRFKKGKGMVYIHLEPLFLTNYYLLKKKNEKFAEAVLSYIPPQETIWFVDDSTLAVSYSPMRVILSHSPLKYAWWILLGGLILFAIFTAKRKQRVVPIIEPPKNKSAEFVKSIGNLYLQEGDFHDMMNKKAQYFLYKVRTELLIDTTHLNEVFAKRLHTKTNQPMEKISKAIALIQKAQNPYATVQKEDLEQLNQLLDEILRI